jgi:hypothetical protein
VLTASPSILPQDSFNYSLEDLEFMRHAFQRACDENAHATETTAQRYALAQAIVNRFERGLSESDLIAIALQRAH